MKICSILGLALILSISILTVDKAFAANDVHFHGAVHSDKNQFHKGDVINFNGWSNAYQDWKAGYTELPDVTFDINIVGPDNQSIFKKSMTSDEKGNIHFSIPVDDDFKFGKYVIKASISKEGFPIYYQDEESSFYVIRTTQDIVQAKGYDFKIWAELPDIKYQSYPKLSLSICPSPTKVLTNESFVDPETGMNVDASYGIVNYYFTRPDGTKTHFDQYGQILYSWFNWSTCPDDKTDFHFYANMGGNWTAYAVAKWISNGTLYEIQSDTASFHVIEPQFPIKITKIVNMTAITPGIDISQDKKFIIFITSTNDESGNYGQLWMMHPDGTNLQKIDTEKKFQQLISPKISPSGDLILWSGAYYDSNTPVYGLFVYDLNEGKLEQISNGNGNPDTIGEFHWTQDNKIAYVTKKWGNVSHNLSTSLIIYDPKGNVIQTTQTADLSSIDLYRDPDHFGQMTISVQSYAYSGGGAVSIKSTDGFEEKIFEKPNGSDSPVSAAISSDGKTVIFGYYEGVYVATLDKSVTEYKPVAQPVSIKEPTVTPQQKQPVTVSNKNQSSIKFDTPINLSNDGRSQNPRIEVSGNNVYIVWEGFKSGNGEIYFKKSSDGGDTFGDTINLSNNDGRSYDPQIIISKNNVYVTWSDESRGHPISTISTIATSNTMFVKSTDGGATFSVPKNLSIKNVYSQATVNHSPKIAVSGNNVYVEWQVGNFNWQNVFLAKSTDNGATFDDPKNLSNLSGTQISQQPNIVAAGNNVYVTWQTYDTYNDPPYGVITLAKSTDGGSTFSVTKLTTEGVTWDPIAYADGNNLYALWRGDDPQDGIIFAKSADGGATFSKTKLGIAGLIGNVGNKWIGKNGNPYVVFTDGTDIFLTKSDDGGNTFANVINLSNNTWTLNPYDDRPFPQISVLGNNVFVAWKYTISPDGNHAPFFVASTDGGNTFSVPIKLSQSAGDSREIPQMAASGNHIYVVYSDTIPTGSDLFLVKGTSPQMSSEEAEKSSTENNSPAVSILEQLLNWLKQIFHFMLVGISNENILNYRK